VLWNQYLKVTIVVGVLNIFQVLVHGGCGPFLYLLCLQYKSE